MTKENAYPSECSKMLLQNTAALARRQLQCLQQARIVPVHLSPSGKSNRPTNKSYVTLFGVRLLSTDNHPVVPPPAPQVVIVLFVVRRLLYRADRGRRGRQPPPNPAARGGASHAAIAENAAVVESVILSQTPSENEIAKSESDKRKRSTGRNAATPSTLFCSL